MMLTRTDDASRGTVVADELYENPMGTTHDGIVATLVDTAMGSAVSSMLPADAQFTTRYAHAKSTCLVQRGAR